MKSVRKPATQYPIDPVVQARLDTLERLIDAEYAGSAKAFEAKTGIKMAQVSQWFTGYRALRDKALRRLEEKTRKPQGYFDGAAPVDRPYAPAPPSAVLHAQEPAPPDYLSPELAQVLRDLNDLPPARRSKIIDQIHQAAEEIREALEYHRQTTASVPATTAAARISKRRNPTAFLTYGDGNSRQAVLPLSTVPDPFTAKPDEREVALYRNIERSKR